jgi:hypothetical protein
MSEPLTCESFAEALGGKFVLQCDSGETLELELIEATPYPQGEQRQGRKPFSAVFRGVMDPVLPQQIYRLEHETIGSLELFLVPIGPDQQGQQYEAVFS